MKHCNPPKEKTRVVLFERSEVLPPDWDGLLPEGHFLKKGQLAVTEKANLPDLSYIYALIYHNGKPVAASYFQIFRLKQYHLDKNHATSMQHLAWSTFSKMLHPKLLVGGHLFRHDICSYYWDTSFSAFEAYNFYRAAIKKATRRSGAMAVLVKDMDETLVPYFQNYAPEYKLLRNDISMEMDVESAWRNMKDYEKALKHKYAQRYRKIKAGWEKVEVRELTAEDVWKEKETIYQLYHNISLNQTVRLGILSKDYLPLLQQEYPDQLKLWMVYEEGKAVAFFSAWLQETALDMFYIGMDYSRNEELQLYFNILFFSVEQTIAQGKNKLILGRTALEAKARLGCKPKYLSTYLHIPNKVLRTFVNSIQENVKEGEGAWENRHPLKPVAGAEK